MSNAIAAQPVTAELVTRECLNLWMNNPMMEVALEGMGMVLLSAACQMDPAVCNNQELWDKGLDRPSPNQSPSTEVVEVRRQGGRYILLDNCMTVEGVGLLLREITAVVRHLLIGVGVWRRPIYGSMRLTLHMKPGAHENGLAWDIYYLARK